MPIGVDDYNYDGIHKLKHLRIYSHNGESFNMAEVLANLSIYEDMFSTNITAHATFYDTTNSLMHMSILGNEKVFIEIALPGEPKNLKYNLYVNAISNKEKIGEGKTIFTLELISQDAFNNIKTAVSKTYKDKYYHQMVQDLHGRVSGKGLQTEKSEGLWTLPLPYTKPVKAINMINKYAKSEEHQQPSYMYFEREDSYWWKTIDIMMTAGPVASFEVVKKDYRPEQKEEYGSMTDTSMTKQNKSAALSPDKIQWTKYFDLVDAMSSGMFDSELIHIDYENKKFSVETFSYMTEFDKRDGLGLHAKDMKGAPLPQGKPDLVAPLQSSKNRIQMMPVQNESGRPKITKEKLIRDGRLKEIDFCKINLEVPGNPWIHAGDIVDVQIISDQAMDDKAQVALKEKYHKGKFLVTAAANHVSSNKWVTVLELATDNLDMKFDEEVYTVSRSVKQKDVSPGGDTGII